MISTGGDGLRRAAVAAGAVAGVAARVVLIEVLPIADVPVGVLVANLVGAFLLGWAVAVLPEGTARVLVTTGFLGSFTTFSSLIVLTHDVPLATGATVLLGTVLGGVALARAGAMLGSKRALHG